MGSPSSPRIGTACWATTRSLARWCCGSTARKRCSARPHDPRSRSPEAIDTLWCQESASAGIWTMGDLSYISDNSTGMIIAAYTFCCYSYVVDTFFGPAFFPTSNGFREQPPMMRQVSWRVQTTHGPSLPPDFWHDHGITGRLSSSG